MSFFTYDEANRNDFDSDTQQRLDELVQHFGRVELKEVKESAEWCVRVVSESGMGKLPLATLGSSLFEAAERLLRIGVPEKRKS